MPPSGIPPISVPFEKLCTAMAVNASTYTVSTTSIRVDSVSQLQFYVEWTPHANDVGDHTKYMNVQIVYSIEPAGDSPIWRTYVEEQDNGDDTYEFHIKTWKIYADATSAADLWPSFARPFASKRIALQFEEVGTGATNGTVTAKCAAQPI